MGDTLDWWAQGGDWYDRKQQKAIGELERSNARARSQTRSLQRQVEQNQASLTKRVDQLERALRAVVELEDVREELNEHVPAALVRRHARSVVMAVSGLGSVANPSAPPEAPADVPGYWLAPAARWAASLVTSRPDHSPLDDARRRDPVRTDLFVVALSAITEHSIDDSAALDRLLAGPFDVTDWQRELWMAMAAGRFGSPVRASLIGELRIAAESVTREQLSVAVLEKSAASKPVESGRRLAALSQKLVPRMLPPESSESDDSTTPAEDAGGGVARNDRLAELLAVIVEEGAPGEVAVLDSMTDIRRVLADDAAMQPPERRVVDDTIGEPIALLLADLGGTDADLRDVAIDVFAADMAAWAEELHAAAASASTPTTMVDVFGQNVEIAGDGVDESTWSGYVDAAHPVEPSPRVSPAGVVGALVVVVGLLFVPIIGPLGLVIAVAGAALAGWTAWTYWQRRDSAQRSAARRAAARKRSALQIEEATKRIVDESVEFELVAATIDASLERIADRVATATATATARVLA